MVIDMHVHPMFLEEAALTEEELERSRQEMGLYKTDAFGISQWERDCRCAGIDRLCILPLDTGGMPLVHNEKVAELVTRYPKRLIGFASVDPNRESAADDLEYAFGKD